MKTKRFLFVVLLLSMTIAFGYNSMAQKGQGIMQGQAMKAGSCLNQEHPMNNMAFLKLTDEQKAKMAELRIALMARNLSLKNQLGEMQAKMHTLQTGDNQDLKAISKVIDDMSIVQAQIRKNGAEHRLTVRALLNTEQKVIFDAHQGNVSGMHRGMKGKFGKGK